MEVRGLKLSSSFFFSVFDQLKSSFKQECKTFQFCKAGKIVSKFNFYTTNLLHKKLVLFDILVVRLMKPKARNRNTTSPAKQR